MVTDGNCGNSFDSFNLIHISGQRLHFSYQRQPSIPTQGSQTEILFFRELLQGPACPALLHLSLTLSSGGSAAPKLRLNVTSADTKCWLCQAATVLMLTPLAADLAFFCVCENHPSCSEGSCSWGSHFPWLCSFVLPAQGKTSNATKSEI